MKMKSFVIAIPAALFIAAILWVVASIVFRDEISKEWSAGGSVDVSYRVVKHFWPPFLADSKFLSPKFTVIVENKGSTTVASFSFEVFLGYVDDPRSFPSFAGPLLDIFHAPRFDLIPGDTREFTFFVPLHSLRPGNAMMGIKSYTWIPQQSIRESITETVEKMSSDPVFRQVTVNSMIQKIVEHSRLDPDAKNPNAFQGREVQSLRFTTPIKIRDFASVSTNYITLLLFFLSSISGLFWVVERLVRWLLSGRSEW